MTTGARSVRFSPQHRFIVCLFLTSFCCVRSRHGWSTPVLHSPLVPFSVQTGDPLKPQNTRTSSFMFDGAICGGGGGRFVRAGRRTCYSQSQCILHFALICSCWCSADMEFQHGFEPALLDTCVYTISNLGGRSQAGTIHKTWCHLPSAFQVVTGQEDIMCVHSLWPRTVTTRSELATCPPIQEVEGTPFASAHPCCSEHNAHCSQHHNNTQPTRKAGNTQVTPQG